MLRPSRSPHFTAAVVLTVCCVLLAPYAPSASANDKPLGISKTEAKRRLAKLRKRARDLQQVQKLLRVPCPACSGIGSYPIYVPKRNPATGVVRQVYKGRVDCSSCGREAKSFDGGAYVTHFWEYKSPAFRASQERRSEITAEIQRLADTHGLPDFVSLANVRQSELITATHAISWVKTQYQPRVPFRWIYAKEGTKWKWWVYDERTDGVWPDTGIVPSGERAKPITTPGWMTGGPLTSVRLAAVTSLVLPTLRFYELRTIRREDTTLLVYADLREEANPEGAGLDAVAVARALFRGTKDFDAVRCLWLGSWRDRLGRVETRPVYTSEFKRETHDKVVWDNLEAHEQVDVLDWAVHQYEGWKPWQKKAPAPDVKGPAQPAAKGPAPQPDRLADTPVVTQWVKYKGRRYPARGTYGHGGTLTPTYVKHRGTGYKTSVFPLTVRPATDALARAGGGTVFGATVYFACAKAEASQYGLSFVQVHMTIEHAGDAQRVYRLLAGNAQWRVDGKTESRTSAPFGKESRTTRGHSLAFEVAFHASETSTLLKGKELVLRMGDDVEDLGIAFVFDARARLALADLMSRVVPK